MVKTTSFKGHSFAYDESANSLAPQMYEGWTKEVESREKLFADLKEGDVFVDIGSCCGGWTMPAAAAGARVYSFDMKNQGVLESIELNSSHIRNRITFFEEPMWSTPGLPADTSAAWAVSITTIENGKVKTNTLDNHTEIENVRYIKIDVEGNELEVLKGSRNTIQKYRPYIVVECHENIQKGMTDKVIELMNEINPDYSCEIVVQDAGTHVSHVYFR